MNKTSKETHTQTPQKNPKQKQNKTKTTIQQVTKYKH